MRKVPQNIRNYFINYTKRLTPTSVPSLARAKAGTNSQKIGDAIRRSREFIQKSKANGSDPLARLSQQRGRQSNFQIYNSQNYSGSTLNNGENDGTCNGIIVKKSLLELCPRDSNKSWRNQVDL